MGGRYGASMNSLKILLAMGLFSALFSTVLNGDPIAVGAKAPQLKATAQDGSTVDLGKLYGEGMVLVYFYPKADTPGCTAQACNLRDNFSEIQEQGITVLGVSMDDTKAQAAFQSKYSLPFTLIADQDGKVVDAFGVPKMGMFARRQAYLVKDGVVVWRDLAAKPKTQTADVLAAVASLN